MKNDKFKKLSDNEIEEVAGAATEKYDCSPVYNTGKGWNSWVVYDRFGRKRARASSFSNAANKASELDREGKTRIIGDGRYKSWVNNGDLDPVD